MFDSTFTTIYEAELLTLLDVTVGLLVNAAIYLIAAPVLLALAGQRLLKR